LYPELRVNSDAGEPVKNFMGNAKLAEALEGITRNLVNQVQMRHVPGPELNIT
jgi:hypothetical protein